MYAWLQLTKKEFRLGLPALLVPIVIFVFASIVSFLIAEQNGFGWEGVFGAAMFVVGLQFFYLVYYLLYSLHSEKKKLHLWLHNPLPSYLLLLAKVVAGLVSMLITLLVTGITLIVSLNLSNVMNDYIERIGLTKVVFFLGSHLILIALSLAVLFLFFWMIYLLYTRFFGTFLSFVFTFITFILLATVYDWVTSSELYDILTKWGAIQVNMLKGFSVTINDNGSNVIAEPANLHLYIGSYVFETVLALILFFITSWLLDKRIEV
ncbi:hypothetical protein [Salirhabdus salicampi]|uniref:hypothetical protein n=1 Tax=Salirhabdus salicampi TaxID=476102 RepID=UPI0020C40191|nr:hypothetical protein [Salirhabdus salicampi]MCP8616289.1 hypothetical protein [Salirhabdus salicampi]